MTDKATGAYPPVTQEDVRELCTRYNLTALQLGGLARSSVQAVASGRASRTAQRWREGVRKMSLNTYELVTAKLWLVEHGHATLDQVIEMPLKDVLASLLSHAVNTTK